MKRLSDVLFRIAVVLFVVGAATVFVPFLILCGAYVFTGDLLDWDPVRIMAGGGLIYILGMIIFAGAWLADKR